MDRRTAIIVTVVAAILCGCPGLISVFWGLIAAVVSFIPNADINIGGSSDPTTALVSGLGSCCFGLIFIAIPVAIGFFTLRNKAAATDISTPPSSM